MLGSGSGDWICMDFLELLVFEMGVCNVMPDEAAATAIDGRDGGG